MHYLEQIGGWIESLIAAIGYPGIVLAMALENIFPPIPSEAVLPFAGALSAKGELNFWGAIAAGTAGSLIGAVVLYAIGYIAREAGVRRLVESYGRYVFISEKDLDRSVEWFERYGEAVVFFGRLIPLIRSIISVPAGYARMNFLRFLIYTTLGTTLWNLILTSVGRALGENWTDISDLMAPYENGALVVLALIVLLFFGWRAMRWRQQRNEP
ncbi:MAG: DedA family protein [Dehalococcoidia bacterium]|nr:DedA family protein [Dehalococcoidia bacterium]